MNNILNNKQWKAFHISCVFDIEGTITTHPSLLKEGGKTPRITCSSQNNGLDGCYYNAPTEYGNVLTVDSAADGYISYQQADFIATDHVEKLVFKKEHNYPFNKYLALFIKMCIDSAKKGKYSYGYKFAQRRINRQYIMLPVTPEGIPDWQFMEDYMKQIEHTLLQRYKNHIYLNINNIEKMGGVILT